MKYKEYIITYRIEDEFLKTAIELGTNAKEAWETFKKQNPEAELVDIRKI